MRIIYNVLWLENESTWLSSAIELVEDFLDELGFQLKVKPFEEISPAQELIQATGLEEFDLIFVDHGLKNQDNGAKFIQIIREKRIYTEVVFYSQNYQGLRDEVRELELDGVYCSHRDITEFESIVQAVVTTTIKKTQSLANMRGLVMAETSIIEAKFEEILEMIIDSELVDTPEYKQYVTNVFMSNFSAFKDVHELIEQLKEYIHTNLQLKAQLENSLLDFSKKKKLVSKLLKSGKNELEFSSTYFNATLDQIIKDRNDLAHCTEQFVNGRHVLKTRKGDREFSHEDFVAIRKQLISAMTAVDSILGNVSARNSQT